MAKITPIDRLSQDISKILSKYALDTQVNLAAVTKTVAQRGAVAMRRESKPGGVLGGEGQYAKSWTSKVEVHRLYSTGIIYSKQPGLPHLLEHGHALRQGGRTRPHVHIAPVEDTVMAEYVAGVTAAL